VPESGDIRWPEALLAVAMEDGDEVELACEPVGDLAGSVGRVVVDHEHPHAERLERAHHRLEVLSSLYVGKHTVAFGIAA